MVRFAFNQQMGISNSVNGMVGATRYELTPKDGGYVFDGQVRPFGVQTARYKLRGADGTLVDKPLLVQSTVHGSVFTRPDRTVAALRVAGLHRPGMLQQYFDLAGGCCRTCVDLRPPLRVRAGAGWRPATTARRLPARPG